MAGAKAPLNERLFDALASVKILTSQVAMHLDREWRDKLFRQLHPLHDPAELEAGDEPIQQSSFATFLKAILDINPERRPGLGLSQAGHLIAAWTTGPDRLTIEFLPDDRVIWVLARYVEDEPERFAGQTPVTRLTEGLDRTDRNIGFHMQARVRNLPDEHHVIRNVSWRRLRRDEDDNVLGFLPQAFQLRADEEYLSVNWLNTTRVIELPKRGHQYGYAP